MTEAAANPSVVTTPPDWAADVVLRDGSTVCLRRPCHADRHAIETLIAGLSDQSRYFRLLQYTKGSGDAMLDLCLGCDYPRTLSLVAERGGEILGVATWACPDGMAQQAAGGTFAEVLKDTAYRLTPLTDVDASEMVRSLKSAPLLEGYRGRPPADTRALRDALLRLSLLVEACPGIQEIDLNPVRVLRRGLVVLDARVRVDATVPARSRRIWY